MVTLMDQFSALGHKRPTPRFRLFLWLSVLLGAAAVAACWIVPWRLVSHPCGSYYTFGCVTEEYVYVQLFQPFISGTNALNPINGVADGRAISQAYLENALRTFLSLTGLDAVDFVWAWRCLMPVACAALAVCLSRACLPRRGRPWGWELCLAAAAALVPIYYQAYAVLLGQPYCFSYLNRIPTNIEYPLSLALMAAFLQLARTGRLRWGLLLSLAALALLYFRFYAAIPWGMALACGLVWMVAAGQLAPRVWLTLAALLAAGLIPWAAILRWNCGVQGHVEMMGRYFQPQPYRVHSHWPLHLALAALCWAAGWRLDKRLRPVVWGGAAGLAALPFVCALPASIRSETLLFDRYSCFYLTLVAAAALLLLGQRSLTWRGRAGRGSARRAAAALLAAGTLATVFLARSNATADFVAYMPGQYASIAADARYWPAYRWVREHTPSDALFIVDDGFDWARLVSERDPTALLSRFRCHNDLFSLLARRRRVHTELLFGAVMRDEDYDALCALQRGSLGCPVAREDYLAALRRCRPTHLLWRKHPPLVAQAPPPAIPRGPAVLLQPAAKVVYDDEACVIWELDWFRLDAAGR